MASKAIASKNHKQSLLNASFTDLFKPSSGWFNDGAWQATSLIPAVNIIEDDKKFKLLVAAPGLNKDDFKIDVAGNLLTISAEKEENTEEKEYNQKEYSYSSFSRSFSLPEEVKQDAIEAEYKDGQLVIILPKNDKILKKSKSVKIK